MQFFSGFCFLLTVLVVQGCDQCETMRPDLQTDAFAPIEGDDEILKARNEYEEMTRCMGLCPRDTLIELSPKNNFLPPSFFVKRCSPNDCPPGTRSEAIKTKNTSIPVKQDVKDFEFYYVTVEEHTHCRCVPSSPAHGRKPNKYLDCKNCMCKSIDEDLE